MDYKSLIDESNIQNNYNIIESILQIHNQSSKDYIKQTIATKWNPTNSHILSNKISSLSAKLSNNDISNCTTLFQKLAITESELQQYITKYATANTIQDGSLSLLYFRGENTWQLNFIPFFLSIWCFAKKYIFPGIQLLLPILTLLAPYLLLKFVFNMPLTISNYFSLIKKLYLGNVDLSMNNFVEYMKSIIQVTGFVITLYQSASQGIQHAIHLHTIEDDINKFGSLLNSYLDNYTQLQIYYKQYFNIKLYDTGIPAQSDRLTALWYLQFPKQFSALQQIVGKIETQFCLASAVKTGSLSIPTWIKSAQPVLQIKNAMELSLYNKNGKPITIKLHKHSILTGPNRGGKSTALRTILQTLILAHTFGIVLAESATLTPIHFIHSCLRLEDKPGKASLFEREIEWAVNSLQNNTDQFGFICIDELFHGTNPNDSLIASKHYLQQLWKQSNIISIISTHQFELVNNNDNILHYCCPATENDDGTMNYSYGLEKGICKLSSVNDILYEKGLRGKS